MTILGMTSDYGGKQRPMVHSSVGLISANKDRMLSTPMVTIQVGPSQRSFYIHHELLCRYSLFFRDKLHNANASDHGGGDGITITLEDDETSFAVFAEWLFLGEDCDTGKILKDTLENNEDGTGRAMWAGNDIDKDPYDFSLQFRCYQLADTLQAPGFKNQIMEEIQYHGEFCDRELPTMEQVRFVHDRFGRDDPLWRFCVNVKRWDSRFRDAFGDSRSI